MKRIFKYVAIIFIVFLIPKNVFAVGLCDNRTMADYRELASNIKVYTDYRIVDNQAIFDVIITNLPKDVYVLDTVNNKYYQYSDFTTETELILKDYRENQKLNFDIYMNIGGCYGQKLTTIYANLPNYNEYSSDEVCKGVEEYSLCQRWGSVSTGYNDFVSKVNEYKIKKQQQTNKPYTPSEPTMKDKILAFIGDYYIYLIGGVALMVLLLTALKTWATNKNEFDFKV